ncbi:fungal-specific transcription factor domain-containing protein [Aspergillus crustosus]
MLAAGVVAPPTDNTTALYTNWAAYPFLDLKIDSDLPECDINLLQQRGCFSVPVRWLLDEFVREYFLRVHPNLPVINEADFWDAYTNTRRDPIGLILFQAMLFAACSFVSQSCINSLGFKSARAARSAFYQRAKTLYDLEMHHDTFSAAQSALLLTYYAPSRNPNTNSYWLTVALHHARLIQAHRYYEVKHEKANMLKRIWWACVCRDRLLSLGLRRRFQISAHDFDFTQSALTISDFSDEIHRSLVYGADSKRALIQLLSSLCELAVALTNGLALLSPITSVVSTNHEDLSRSIADLTQWHKRNADTIELLGEIGMEHDSFVLYRNVLFIYYYSAQLALHNHAIYIAMVTCQDSAKKQIDNSRTQLQHPVSDPIQGITECLVELGQRNLLGYLPITTAANITLPLAWYIIGTQVSSMEVTKTISQATQTIYTKAMKFLQAHYEGTDLILDYIQKIIHQLRFQANASRNVTARLNWRPTSPFSPTSCSKTTEGHEDSLVVYNLAHCPLREYVRISQTLEVSLAIGRFPERTDLPIPLQSLKLHIDTRLYHSITRARPARELLSPARNSPTGTRASETQRADHFAVDNGDQWDRLTYEGERGVIEELPTEEVALVTRGALLDPHASPGGFDMFPSASSSGGPASLPVLLSDDPDEAALMDLFNFDQPLEIQADKQ